MRQFTNVALLKACQQVEESVWLHQVGLCNALIIVCSSTINMFLLFDLLIWAFHNYKGPRCLLSLFYFSLKDLTICGERNASYVFSPNYFLLQLISVCNAENRFSS